LIKINNDTTENQARLVRLLTALLKMREKCLMKPDEPIYNMVEVPLLTKNTFNFLHADDYLKENVELSTFTPNDDIVLKLKDRFLAFDKHGN